MSFTHFDEKGNARMVDVSEKEETVRTALACGTIRVSSEIMDAILHKTITKGDVLTVAQVAGIAAVKKTYDLIPMCHNISITNASIEFEVEEEKNLIHAYCTVKTEDKTGVEMEALCGVNVALLTIYDMCKAVDKRMVMEDIHLVKKTGGKSGNFEF